MANVLELAGAPGFEPGDGGIKIRCLTTWLRPNTAGAPRIAAASGEFNETLRPPGRRSMRHLAVAAVDRVPTYLASIAALHALVPNVRRGGRNKSGHRRTLVRCKQ